MENNNPNSHESMRSSSWSDLPLDLLGSVFERLGFADFQRVKPVCSSWHAASKTHVPKNHTPWLIIFPDRNNNNFGMLFDPEEKDKLYKTRNLGLEFGKSVCVATYGNWLLMRDRWWNLYIVNIFKQERINVVPMMKWITDMQSSVFVFWIDDKTKDFVVLWGLGEHCVYYSMNGDTWWKQIPETCYCMDLVYKDHKLYFLSLSNDFKVFDFSGGMIPRETFECDLLMNKHMVTKLVVTVKGDVLKVEKYMSSFYVYKFYSSDGYKNPEQVYSLGDDEAMLFDSGVLVDGLKGVKKNSIYCNPHGDRWNEIFLFNLKTRKPEKLHKFDRSFNYQLDTARWFLPSFK